MASNVKGNSICPSKVCDNQCNVLDENKLTVIGIIKQVAIPIPRPANTPIFLLPNTFINRYNLFNKHSPKFKNQSKPRKAILDSYETLLIHKDSLFSYFHNLDIK